MSDKPRKALATEAQILAIAKELDGLLSDLSANVSELTARLADATQDPPPDTGPQERLVLP
jgi:hypothetical protein